MTTILPPIIPSPGGGGGDFLWGRELDSVLGLSFPTPPVPPFRGQRPAPLCGNIVNSRGPGTCPFPHGSPSTWGRGRRSKCKGSRCWSLSFIFGGGGGGRVGSGGMFEEPPRALSGGWDGTRGTDRSKGWVALRDLGSKFGFPSTLGSLASYCKAKGEGSPMGGEVTGIGRGGVGLLEPAPPMSPPRPWSAP